MKDAFMTATAPYKEDLYFKFKDMAAPPSKDSNAVFPRPLHRVELRPDFPATIDYIDSEEIMKVVEQELLKLGTSSKHVKKINIAYPHKHPVLFPGHINNAEKCAASFQKNAQHGMPHVQWVVASAICETRRLGRSENQTSVHALMNRQIYDIHKPSQKDFLPFLERPQQDKEFFVVVDGCIEQGTTIANLISYLTYNGGTVLAAASGNRRSLIQVSLEETETAPLSEKFANSLRNSARLPQLALAFSQSAQRDGKSWAPERCLNMFEDALNQAHNSVFALTNGECQRILDTLIGHRRPKVEFPALLAQMKKAAPQP
jgi:hypothetical protein